MELIINDYVRTRWGCIAKFEGIHEGFYEFDNIIMDESSAVREELFVDIVEKSSPNIIDLIEVGDVISYKDGSIARVIEIPYTNPNNHKYYLIKDISGEQYYERDEWLLDNIKSIVTKEQFESMEYKIC